MKASGVLGAAAFIASLVWACSLVDRDSDYFDPSGSVVTLAALPNATDLVLTRDAVFVRDDRGLERVPKAGGEPWLVVQSTTIDLVSSDGVGRVVWHDAQGVHHRDDDSDASALDVPNTNAEAVGATADRVAYTIAPPAGDPDGGRPVFVVSDGGVSAGDLLNATHPLVITSVDGTFYFGLAGGIDRETNAADPPPVISDSGLSTCTILKFSVGNPADEVQADPSADASFRALLVSPGRMRAVTGGPCCTPPAGNRPCTFFDGSLLPIDVHTTALRDGWVYRADGARIVRFRFDDLAATGQIPTNVETLVQGGIYDAAYLAVDDEYVFFISNSRIQRASIRDAQ